MPRPGSYKYLGPPVPFSRSIFEGGSGRQLNQGQRSGHGIGRLFESKSRTYPAKISGYVLKLARESVAMTQEELACSLQVDPHTIHSWETGRRALTATNTGTFIRLQYKLATLGIRPLLLGALRTPSRLTTSSTTCSARTTIGNGGRASIRCLFNP